MAFNKLTYIIIGMEDRAAGKVLSWKQYNTTSFPGLFPRKKNGGREKALASAGHVFILHPEILGVIN